MANYALDNAWELARRRLGFLEQYLDPATFQRLAALGVSAGWRCLEVGGGGGSVARWLCRRIGPTGKLTATDLDTRFLQEIAEPNLELRRHDITAEELPQNEYDLVHTRWLLHHLPNPEPIVKRMVSALKPGGWLLVEEPDFFPVQTSASPLYVDYMTALVNTVVSASGRDGFWARALPALVASCCVTDLGGAADVALLQGGSPVASLFRLTGVQMRDRLLAAGAIAADRLDAALQLLDDPQFLAFSPANVAVWGRKPTVV